LEHFDCKTYSVGKVGVIDDFLNFLLRKIFKLSEKDLIKRTEKEAISGLPTNGCRTGSDFVGSGEDEK
ncbi:hypothetical protein, partial [Alistipes putredinis]|uniref:hypothetical protein n=1 Tax=Alistipes putredinis TaxID=28117 RepID=UPI003AB6D518